MVWDDRSGVDLQVSYAVTGVNETFAAGMGCVGVGISMAITNADSVEDLIGYSTAKGATIGPALYAGVDALYNNQTYAGGTIQENSSPDGYQVNFGVGLGLDAHCVQSYTKSILSKSGNYRPGIKANNGRNTIMQKPAKSFNDRSK